MKWKKIGSGTYNNVYQSGDKKLIFKIQKNDAAMDVPERSVRLWNQINPDFQPPAYEYDDPQLGHGWVCPFVSGKPSSDREIAAKLIDIFNETDGRIIIDAWCRGNFLTTAEGRVICVDVGMALQLEKEKSLVSTQTWFEAWEAFQANLKDRVKPNHPHRHTVDTIKALLFIKSYRPDIKNVNFLIGNAKAIARLSIADSAWSTKMRNEGKEYLNALHKQFEAESKNLNGQFDSNIDMKDEILSSEDYTKNSAKSKKNVAFNRIKLLCIWEIEKYIESRGSINKEFTPTIATKMFKNNTADKVELALKLTQQIALAQSLDEIEKILIKGHDHPLLNHESSSSLLIKKIEKCRNIIDSALEQKGDYSQQFRKPDPS